eukprot:6932116-Prymnesium_polylepis.1
MDQIKADIKNANMEADQEKTKLADLEKAALTEEQIEEIREAFNLIDRDHSGRIDYLELRDACVAPGFDGMKEDLRKMITDPDVNGTGMNEFFEFVWIITGTAWREVEFRKAFYDDITGKIGFSEAYQLNQTPRSCASLRKKIRSCRCPHRARPAQYQASGLPGVKLLPRVRVGTSGRAQMPSDVFGVYGITS